MCTLLSHPRDMSPRYTNHVRGFQLPGHQGTHVSTQEAYRLWPELDTRSISDTQIQQETERNRAPKKERWDWCHGDMKTGCAVAVPAGKWAYLKRRPLLEITSTPPPADHIRAKGHKTEEPKKQEKGGTTGQND